MDVAVNEPSVAMIIISSKIVHVDLVPSVPPAISKLATANVNCTISMDLDVSIETREERLLVACLWDVSPFTNKVGVADSERLIVIDLILYFDPDLFQFI